MDIYVKDLESNENLAFLDDSEVVFEINREYSQSFDSYFALIECGEFIELYGMVGIIPSIYKRAYPVILEVC